MAVQGGGLWTNTWLAGYIAAGQPAPPPPALVQMQ